MGDVGEFWDEVKAARKAAGLPARRSPRPRAEAPSKKESASYKALGLRQLSEWHWQVRLDVALLDYWPSKAKWRWRNMTEVGPFLKLVALVEAQKGAAP